MKPIVSILLKERCLTFLQCLGQVVDIVRRLAVSGDVALLALKFAKVTALLYYEVAWVLDVHHIHQLLSHC